MSENVLKNVRIVHKHDTEENWLKAINFIPKQGELIIYDVDNNYNYERMKIGDGKTLVNDLPFSNDWKSLENKPFDEKITETNEYLIKDCIASSPGICNAEILSRFREEEIVNVSINDEVLTNQLMRSENYTSITGYHYGFFCGNPTLLPLYHTDVQLGGDLVDTGEDFLIYLQDSDNHVGSYAAFVILRNYPDESVVSVYRTKTETELKTLDEKFIPDTIARTSDLESKADISLVTDIESALYNAIVENDIEDKAYVDEKIAAIPQSDWNQNDESAPDYIKNRTHGIVKKAIFEGQNLGAVQLGMVDSSFPSITLGESYKVIYNGYEYTATCKRIPGAETDNTSGYYIGNPMLLFGGMSGLMPEEGMGDIEDTGEPFLLLDLGMIVVSAWIGTEFNFSIYDDTTHIGDYTAAMVMSDYSQIIVVLDPNEQIIENNQYDIVLDDVLTTCICKKENDLLYLGNMNMVNASYEDTGEVFCCEIDKSGSLTAIRIYTTESKFYDVKIIGDSYMQLSDKYLNNKPGRFYENNILQAGEIFNDYADNVASGGASHAEGSGTTASGDYTHAEGYQTQALGNMSHAEGYKSVSQGHYSHAESFAMSIGAGSHAEGGDLIDNEINNTGESIHTSVSTKVEKSLSGLRDDITIETT